MDGMDLMDGVDESKKESVLMTPGETQETPGETWD
jgi:hypothetical protein